MVAEMVLVAATVSVSCVRLSSPGSEVTIYTTVRTSSEAHSLRHDLLDPRSSTLNPHSSLLTSLQSRDECAINTVNANEYSCLAIPLQIPVVSYYVP